MSIRQGVPSKPAFGLLGLENHGGAVTLLLGGARSGKSRYAQQAAAASQRVAYIATAKVTDDEMRCKIARHQAERPANWATFEEPLALESVVRVQGSSYEALIIDCLTVWTANLLDHHGLDVEAVVRHAGPLCDALGAVTSKVFIVSNEVGSGVVPGYESGRAFREALGEINQQVAQIADRVVLMVAGYPLVVK
jgi:adenosylcobinamide kinase/adenosylcobinamide-phosphate guanylyltransferase